MNKILLQCVSSDDSRFALHLGSNGEFVVPAQAVELSTDMLRIWYDSPAAKELFSQILEKAQNCILQNKHWPRETIRISLMGVEFLIEGAFLKALNFSMDNSHEAHFVIGTVTTSRKVPVYESQV